MAACRRCRDLLATLCALLAPPVLSYSLARYWGREALWLRFATAFNWCQWAIPAIACLCCWRCSLLIALGVPNDAAGHLWILGLAGYGLWLHWFLARHGAGPDGVAGGGAGRDRQRGDRWRWWSGRW